MKRNCNLDLRLSNQPQQLTIFYDGQICVSDATEIQARAIIWLASKQTDKERYNPDGNPISPNSTLQYSPTSGMSMKKSLQRFLQKRKHRLMANSPYHNADRQE